MRAASPICFALLLLTAAVAPGCNQRGPYDGLAPAKITGGPTVTFNLETQPPQVPFPNDLLARVDSTSRTGLRVNAALFASTLLEGESLTQLDLLDGFGTYAPITVSFDQDLDVLDLWTRQNDGDESNDAVFLVDLTTGARVPLDFNRGHFPLELPQPQPYFLNDPQAATTNLLFPVDGPFANFLHPVDPAWPAEHDGVPQESDDLLTFYERSTHTLILRPVLPLAQAHSHALVLTDRLVGTDGNPVQSPFSGINHALQTAELQPLKTLALPGTQLEDIAFAWAFTTQSITGDLEAIQEGLEGNGVLQPLDLRFAVLSTTVVTTGLSRIELLPEQSGVAQNPYIIPAATVAQLLSDPQLAGILAPSDPGALAGLIASLGYIDYFVSGFYPSPDLLADPDRAGADSAFQIDVPDAFLRTTYSLVPFLLAVPKIDELHNHTPPFPTAFAGHDSGGSRLDPMLQYAGTLAQYGVATVSVDAYGQGLQLDPATLALVLNVFHQYDLDDFANTLFTSRARDLDGDGIPDPAGDLFTASSFHTRDLIRQTAVDWLQLSRVLRSFTGNSEMIVPSEGAPAVAGDFNLDGIPDVGGPAIWPEDVNLNGVVIFQANTVNPGSDQFSIGIGTGGAVSAIFAAIEPSVRAAAPISTPGGLSDIALRTVDPQIQAGQLLQQFGPLLATCNFSPSLNGCATMAGVADAQAALVWDFADTNRESQIPIAPLLLSPGDTVVACDVTHAPGALPPDQILIAATPVYCSKAVADANGQLRLPLGADGFFSLFVETPQGIGEPAMVQPTLIRYGDRIHVIVAPAAGSGLRDIDSFQFDSVSGGVALSNGSELRAITSGLGRDRNTPGFRELTALWQAVVESGDPINYAPYLGANALPAHLGVAPNVLAIATAGDAEIPTADQIAFGRAAGFVETQAPDPDYGIPIDQVLIDAAVVEGVARLPRFADPASSARLALGSHLLCDPPNDCSAPVVADVSGLACSNGQGCTDGLNAPRLSPPLQQQLWRNTSTGIGALEIADFARTGQHGLAGPQPQKPFDLDLFLENQIGRYFETRGAELHLEPCQAQLAQCPWNSYPPPY